MDASMYTPGQLVQKLSGGDHVATEDLLYLKGRLDRVVVDLSGFGDRYLLVLADANLLSSKISNHLWTREVSE